MLRIVWLPIPSQCRDSLRPACASRMYVLPRCEDKLTFGEVYLRRAHVRPDRPAPFPDVLRPPSVRYET